MKPDPVVTEKGGPNDSRRNTHANGGFLERFLFY